MRLQRSSQWNRRTSRIRRDALPRIIARPLATSQDQSVQPRYAATWRGVMQVGLLRSHGRLLRPISACDRMKLQTFFDAAHLLICCETRWAGRDMPVGLLIVSRTSTRLGACRRRTRSSLTRQIMQKKVVPMFHVPDVRQTVDWYRDIGFEVTVTYDDNAGGLSFAHGVVRSGRSDVQLGRPPQFPSPSRSRLVRVHRGRRQSLRPNQGSRRDRRRVRTTCSTACARSSSAT